MAKTQVIAKRIVLDTNVLISALIFNGLPREILRLVLKKEIIGVVSPSLLSELLSVLAIKFNFSQSKLILLERKLKAKLMLVYPQKEINACRDAADSRVLEAAVEGQCQAIITGDQGLLVLKKYRQIKIVTPKQLASGR
jgi:putative PIN family toxin of toxin-antitoxin system